MLALRAPEAIIDPRGSRHTDAVADLGRIVIVPHVLCDGGGAVLRPPFRKPVIRMLEVSSRSTPIALTQHWRDGGVLVVSVQGELDLFTSPWLTGALDAACAQRPAVLVVDLTEVSFLGSTAMTTLLSAQRDVGDSVRFVVVAVGPVTARPLGLLGIDRVMPVLSSLEQALAHLAGGDGGPA